MAPVAGIDHVVFNATDLEATCAFYDRLFGITTHAEYAKDGKVLVRQVAIGGAVLASRFCPLTTSRDGPDSWRWRPAWRRR
jgi:catechol 2,3-dioxygenase-like lactoylglutathione lyase family enzyme